MPANPPQSETDVHTRICSGCGGRNPPGATECDWCARPFLSGGGPIPSSSLHALGGVLVIAAVLGLGLLAVLNAGRPIAAVRSARATRVPTARTLPTAAVTAVPTPSALPAPAPSAAASAHSATTPPAAATPTAVLARAQIAHTGGLGAILRTQPGPNAAAVTALREGTVVLLTGEEQTVAARVWRKVQLEGTKVQGWVLDDFLQPQS